jgi:hypothetical protein
VWVSEQESTRRPAVGLRIELQQASKILRGTVEQADDELLLVRWDSGGFSTLRADRAGQHITGRDGVSERGDGASSSRP